MSRNPPTHFSYSCGSCGYPLNLTSSCRITSGIGSEHRKSIKKGFIASFLFMQVDERVLHDAGYVPSNTEKYPLGGVITAIQNAFHLTPEVACSNGAVQEIYLCFYKDFTPRECAVGARSVLMKETSKSSCPKYVSLPEFVSKGQKLLPEDLMHQAI